MIQPIANLGFRVHSGWAIVVALAGTPEAPVVVHRRRLELADPAVHGSVQPYHTAKAMKSEEAVEFIQRCRNCVMGKAEMEVRAVIAELSRYRVSGAAILLASGRPIPELAAILASHPLMHTAEGVFFREPLLKASAACGLAITPIKERDLISEAAARLGIPAVVVEQRVTMMGKVAGPPWRQDEKLAAVAAWLILGTSSHPAS